MLGPPRFAATTLTESVPRLRSSLRAERKRRSFTAFVRPVAID